MILEIQQELALFAPLEIKDAGFESEYLTLLGEEWNFHALTPWRVVEGNRIRYGHGDPDAHLHVRTLVGDAITGLRIQSDVLRTDPAFMLSDGAILEVFSDHYYEPWTMRLPTGLFVALPGDGRYVD
jgi:hypothetical protein